MRKSIAQRLLSWALVLVMVLGLVPANLTGTAEATQEEVPQSRATTDYYQTIRNLPIPVSEKVTPQTGAAGLKDSGTYFIVGNATMNGTTRISVPKVRDTIFKDGYYLFDRQDVTLSSANGVEGLTDLTHAVDIQRVDNDYSISLSDGRFLHIDKENSLQGSDGSMVYNLKASSPQFLTIKKDAKNTNGVFNIGLKDSASGTSGVWMNFNAATFRAINYADPENHQYFDLLLYRVSPLTVELYKSIKHMDEYVKAGAEEIYDPAVYADFITCLDEALALYEQYYNVKPSQTASAGITQEELDAKAEELWSHAGKLTVARKNASYIDIPMEVLDFRSDRFLFEYYDMAWAANLYAMVTLADALPYHTNVNANPGRLDSILMPYVTAFKNATGLRNSVSPGTEANAARTGLTLDTLEKGQLLYKEATVGYLAAALLWDPVATGEQVGKTNLGETSQEFEDRLNGADWNKVFWNMIKDLSARYHTTGKTEAEKRAIVGSWTDTLSKTQKDSGTVTGANGDTLLWKNVSTAFDLAYYCLTNMWRPVEDTLGVGGKPYNMPVKERDTLRLYYDSTTGMYTVDSGYYMFNEGYVSGTEQPWRAEALPYFPQMTPIDGLGFEAGGKETDTGTFWAGNGRGWAMSHSNFHYSIHASGSFVYYENQPQEFSFLGDDDVYFFVNNKLVMDIGGAHPAVGFTLNLREANKTLNLGLEDGKVYPFDMFYAERHSTGSNIRFSTNIKIVSPETLTYKGQYAVEVNGTSTVDSTTGRGGTMVDNQLMNVDDVVAYSFDLANIRTVPVRNLEFYDPSLGVSLKKDNIAQYSTTLTTGETVVSLTDPAQGHGNGVATRYTDLMLEYTTYDTAGNLATGTPKELTAGAMADLIRGTTTLPEGGTDYQFAPLEQGIYRVRVNNADELKELLAVGIPMECYFSLYGFLRKVISTDRPYTNELTTYCYYPRSTDVDAKLSVITGKAARMLTVPASTGMPTMERMDLTLDYGKKVAVPLEHIRKCITFEKGSLASVGDVVGFAKEGHNGQLLKTAPQNMIAVGRGDIPANHGRFTSTATDLIYEPNTFIEQTESIRAVVALNDFILAETGAQYHYALIEIRLIPANMMYYEAEDFVDTELSYEQVGGDFTDWEVKGEEEDKTPYQDFDPTGYRTYSMVIDRDNIPAEAFFADFDGLGYSERYRDHPQYNGYDFDKDNAWYSHNIYRPEYNKHAVNTATGTMELTNITASNSSGPLGPWIQTIISGKSITNDPPLRLNTGENHFAQVRFRVENCRAYLSAGTVSLFLSNSTDTETEGDVAKDDRRVKVTVSNEEVMKGEYMTVNIPLDNTYYTRSDSIDIIRLYIAGYTDDGSGNGRIIIDYIYVGPETGMKQELHGNYLYFGFDDTISDRRRYTATTYSNTNFDAVDTSNYATNWYSSTAPNGKVSILGGYAVLKDAHTSAYDILHTGTTENATPLHYKTSPDDVCRIRIRIDGNVQQVGSDNPKLTLEHVNPADNKKYRIGLQYIDLEEVADGNFHVYTFPMTYNHVLSGTTTPYNITEMTNLRLVPYNMSGATYYIDYIYVGPEALLGEVYERYDYLYFTFDNSTADQERYADPVYGSKTGAIRNYDSTTNGIANYWKSDTDTNGVTITGGCLVLEDKHTATYNFVHGGTSRTEAPFSYIPGDDDVCQIRVKFVGKTTMAPDPGTDGKGTPRFILECEGGGVNAGSVNINLEEMKDEQFHTFTFPLNSSSYPKWEVLNFVRPNFAFIKGATFYIDYIYIGPRAVLEQTTEKADHLFFDFTDTPADRLRYSDPVYGKEGLNFGLQSSWSCDVDTGDSQIVSVNNTAGTLTFKDKDNPHKCNWNYIHTGSHYKDEKLNYTPGKNDVMQIRMKIEGGSAENGEFMLSMEHNVPEKLTFFGKATYPEEQYMDGKYHVFTVPLNSQEYLNWGTLTSVRPVIHFVQGCTITVDYIYVGPLEKVNAAADSLYFGFDNTEEDQLRYAYHTYGGHNYDVVNAGASQGFWATSPQNNSSSSDFTIDHAAGTLTVPVTDMAVVDADGKTGPYGPWLITTNTYGTYSLSAPRASLYYRPEHAEVLQVRFRLKNCQVAPGAKANVVLVYGGYNRAGSYVDYNSASYMRTFYTPAEGYQVISIPINQEFRDMDVITNLGLQFQNILSESDGNGTVEIDYIYLGAGDGTPNTYGYDSSYNVGNLYSDGVSLYAEGNGARTDATPNPAKLTEVTFSFTGTGFDLISCTGAQQGAIRVEIFTDPARNKESRVVGVDVTLKGEMEMFQIPVFSRHGLEYGTYYVSVMVKDKVDYPIPALARGNQFYLDAIRIYDPIDASQGTNVAPGSQSAIAYAAYCADYETHPVITEVRDILLSSEEYFNGGLIQDGAVFVDYSTVPPVITPTTSEGTGGEDITDPSLDVKEHITADIQTYKKIGPNNETYLGAQQLVAFELLVYSNQMPSRVDIGAKGITSSTELTVKVWNQETAITRVLNEDIYSPANQYYNINLDKDMFYKTKDEDGITCYKTLILITNPTPKSNNIEDSVLSVTDIRVAYREKPTFTKPEGKGATGSNTGVELPDDTFAPVRFVVSGELQEQVTIALEELNGICREHTPGQWQTVVPPAVGQEGLMELRCIKCAAVLETKSVAAVPGIDFAGASVSLQSDLSIHFKVDKATFDSLGFKAPYVLIETTSGTTVIGEYKIEGTMYVFTYDGLAPYLIGDMLTAKLYGEYEGTIYALAEKEYSIATYCYNMLAKVGDYDSWATLRTLLVDILNYGAKTQIYSNYKTDSLCNAALTQQQLAWGSTLDREIVSVRDLEYGKIDAPTVTIEGVSLNLQESVAMCFKLLADSYEGLTVEVRTDDRIFTYGSEDLEHRADGVWLRFKNLTAAQMSIPVYFTVYRDGVQVSHTARYSIESYVASKAEHPYVPLADLVKAVMAYGDSARAYMGN